MKELLPYNVSHCTFIASQRIFPINAKNKSDYFYLPFPRYSESLYDEWVKNKRANSLILGPCFVPSLWNLFPYKGFWKERRFREILTTIKGIAVHSTRVRNHLSSRSNTTDLLSKFKIIRPCTNLMPKKIIPFDNRTNDIIFFEKYGDLNRSGEASTLLNLFKNTSKTIKNLVYEKYTTRQMKYLSNISKYIIYFSFYDTGAIGLKEIQNHGVIAFSHQKDLVIDNTTSYYIPELAKKNDLKPAFKKIMKIIEHLEANHPNMELIARTNQEINRCEKALEDLCKGIA